MTMSDPLAFVLPAPQRHLVILELCDSSEAIGRHGHLWVKKFSVIPWSLNQRNHQD